MANRLVLDDLSNREESNSYYLDVIAKLGYENSYEFSPKTEVTSLELEVDRGITDYDELGKLLLDIFPNLRVLKIDQNYSHGGNTEIKHFMNFLRLLKLDKFSLDDSQSKFLDNLDTSDLLAIMPHNSIYKIMYGIDNKHECNIIQRSDTGQNKHLTFYTK